MKRYILATAITMATAMGAMALSDCELNVSVANISDGDLVPEAIDSKLTGRLKSALARTGISGNEDASQFFIAGRFDDAQKDVLGGGRVLLRTTLTLYVGDAENKTIFASKDITLKGSGNSEELAYMNAMSNINGSNHEVTAFINQAKDKIIDYFDKNYNVYLTKARSAMKMRNYDEALFWATSVPECSVGFEPAKKLVFEIYQNNTTYNANVLLAQARAEWAQDPTAAGAAKAGELLAQIDPSAPCAAQAKAFQDQIAKSVKADVDFETKEKYRNEVELEKRRIAANAAYERERLKAARDVATAWAKSRPYYYGSHWYYWIY